MLPRGSWPTHGMKGDRCCNEVLEDPAAARGGGVRAEAAQRKMSWGPEPGRCARPARCTRAPT
eukprot:1922412-Alexandrium_andersonii.AAC.1